jgi:hypothetical protein
MDEKQKLETFSKEKLGMNSSNSIFPSFERIISNEQYLNSLFSEFAEFFKIELAFL